MTDELIGYLLDGLDPLEQDRIERALEADPDLARRAERLRQAIIPLACDDRIEPPKGLAERTVAAVRADAALRTPTDCPGASARSRPLDVIVSVGILVVLAALVLPALITLRGDQERLMCANHLRALGVALAAYAEQEGGQLPYVAPAGLANNAGIFAVELRARDLLPEVTTLLCPSANNAVAIVPAPEQLIRERSNPVGWDRVRRLMAGSFGYELGFEAGMGHSGRAIGSAHRVMAADRPPRETEYIAGMGNSPNHGGKGQNLLYADGSVHWLPVRTVAGDDIFSNRNGVVGAGVGESDICIGVSEATPYPAGEL